MFRNINELGNWIDPGLELVAGIQDVPAKSSTLASDLPLGLIPWHTFTFKFIKIYVEFWNSVFDDIYCICKIRAFKLTQKPWLYTFSDKQCNRLWFTSVLLNLYVERKKLTVQQLAFEKLEGQPEKNEKELRGLAWQRHLSLVNVVKLLADLVFTGEFTTETV